MTECPICHFICPEFEHSLGTDSTSLIDCKTCGKFRISGKVTHDIGKDRLDDFYIYAGAIRELNERGVTPTIDSLEDLLHSVVVPKNPIEKMDRILASFNNRVRSADDSIRVEDHDYAIGYTRRHDEIFYLIRKLVSMGRLEDLGSANYRLDTSGWLRLNELSKDTRIYDQAFVAMSFHDDLKGLWESGIEPALTETGYAPFRVDKKEHNEKIDDRIIAQIRKSGLLVADFTKQSPGVYLEAGFALGLGIPVIWSCKDEEEEKLKLHFDTRQYNHIMWKDIADMKTRLINRINATAPAPKK